MKLNFATLLKALVMLIKWFILTISFFSFHFPCILKTPLILITIQSKACSPMNGDSMSPVDNRNIWNLICFKFNQIYRIIFVINYTSIFTTQVGKNFINCSHQNNWLHSIYVKVTFFLKRLRLYLWDKLRTHMPIQSENFLKYITKPAKVLCMYSVWLNDGVINLYLKKFYWWT